MLDTQTTPARALGVARWAVSPSGLVTLRRFLLVAFIALGCVAAVQRGILTPAHATFRVFRQSFPHLESGQDLYATYPQEQGPEDRDRFKYAPSSALVFAPLTLLPFAAGVAAWTLGNALVVYAAVVSLFSDGNAVAALAIVFPACIAAVQSTSSNGLMAALAVGAFVALERKQWWRGAAAIVVGALLKLFPAALFVLAAVRRDGRRRVFAAAVVVAAIALAAPLAVTSLPVLAAQYASWWRILRADGADLEFARSIMVTIRSLTHGVTSNLAFQVPATLMLLLPVALRRRDWDSAAFRRQFFASLLVYFVIFNHQAENASYVIAAIGLAIWFVDSPRTPLRWLLLAACVAGLEAVPYFLVWLWMQFDLLEGERLLGRIAARAPARVEVAPTRAWSASDRA